MMGFGRRFMIVITSVITIVDFAEFYAISKSPTLLTPIFVLGLIIATMIPIAFNLWYWIPKYKLKW
jgi:hypothetical protein